MRVKHRPHFDKAQKQTNMRPYGSDKPEHPFRGLDRETRTQHLLYCRRGIINVWQKPPLLSPALYSLQAIQIIHSHWKWRTRDEWEQKTKPKPERWEAIDDWSGLVWTSVDWRVEWWLVWLKSMSITQQTPIQFHWSVSELGCAWLGSVHSRVTSHSHSTQSASVSKWVSNSNLELDGLTVNHCSCKSGSHSLVTEWVIK